jgi:hypothetical protein
MTFDELGYVLSHDVIVMSRVVRRLAMVSEIL